MIAAMKGDERKAMIEQEQQKEDSVDVQTQKTGRLSRILRQARYGKRKTAAQGLMDMSLMLANASQLKSVLGEGRSHEHFSLLLGLILTSICLQVVTGFLLMWIGYREEVAEKNAERDLHVHVHIELARAANGATDDNASDDQDRIACQLNNVSVGLVFLILVANLFITAFGISSNASAAFSSGSGSGGTFGDGPSNGPQSFGTGNGST